MKNDIPYYPIQITSGDSFALTFRKNIKDCDTNELSVIDLTEVQTIEAYIVDVDGNVIMPFTSATVSNITTGEITITLSATDSALLVGQDPKRPTETIGTYYVRLLWSDSTSETTLRGKVALTSVQGA